MVGAIVSAEKSFGEKVSAVTGSVKNIKNAAGNAGKTTAKNITQAITEKENKLTQLKKYHDKNKRITKDSSKSDKERKEALAKVDWALKQISSLEKEITSLKDKK
jgi:septal ring factor EnvC (AmiA/AmiB activator)